MTGDVVGAVRVRAASSVRLPELAAVAALTFPLACPPDTTDESKAAFIAAHLSETSFAGYLADPARDVLVAEVDGRIAGYVMLIQGDPADADVAAAIRIRPTIELSKCYVHPAHQGAGVAGALMAAALEVGAARGAAGIWLGVNQENARAQAFYGKHGFQRVGVKRFLLGARYEDDFVYERAL